MDVYTDWCGPCKLLDENTFTNKTFIDYITANYYAVKFNAEGNSEVNYKGKNILILILMPVEKVKTAHMIWFIP